MQKTNQFESNIRHYTPLDKFIGIVDDAIRTIATPAHTSTRPYPAAEHAEAKLSDKQKQHIAGLMRVNHAGEISAQALYQGQAATAKLDDVREKMQHAADEEIDHLNWCAQRLQELDSRKSALDPFWYAGSFVLGAFAGLIGDKWSLGFVVETERQVVAHLKEHLKQVPNHDQRTRAILEQMETDEGHHATVALDAGGAELPAPIKSLMQLMSKVMTSTAYYV